MHLPTYLSKKKKKKRRKEKKKKKKPNTWALMGMQKAVNVVLKRYS
jgi:hypothetical protein